MKLSEIHYSNKFDYLDSQLKNFINQEKHVIFIDSKLSSIINLDPKFKIFELEINESTKDLNTIQKRMVHLMSNTTRLIDKLILKDFVSRETCESNRRKIDIFITYNLLALISCPLF